jgi:hypothetical protein
MSDDTVPLVVRIPSVAVTRRGRLAGVDLGPDTTAELARLVAEHPLRTRGPGGAPSIVLPGGTIRVPHGADGPTVARAIATYLHSELGSRLGSR